MLEQFHKTWLVDPVVFKPKNLSFRNRCANLRHTRDVIRGGSREREQKSIWVVKDPVGGGEASVKLLEEGFSCMLLHVKFLPLRGISCKPSSLIIVLKVMMSFMLAPSLFLSCVEW